MLLKNKSLILILTLLMTSTILNGCKEFIRHDKIKVISNYINKQTQKQPASSPTFNETSTNFPSPKTVPGGTTITINGSTSMAHINQALKIAFQQTFPSTIVNINVNSSDFGIQDLLAQKIDIAAISRPLTISEKQQGLVAIPLTQDAIAIIVGANNYFRRGLTQEQVVGIFTGKITRWSALKGENTIIRVINRPVISGTRKMFQKLVINSADFGNTANFVTWDKDATTPILKALGKDGISYATTSQVAEQTTVRIVPIDGFMPEAASYPYQRTLFYVYKQPANASIQKFLDYVTSDKGKQIIKTVQLTLKDINQTPTSQPQKANQIKTLNPSTPLKNKQIRAIYLSRYQVTNNANEQTIRSRVRYYHSQGINTIIHGVWGNGCTMYNSEVLQQTLGYKSCPNQFNAQWLNWLIDEAHKQGMEVHAYFEKGIKIDKNSPIFELSTAQKWLVPGVDRTYSGIEHYVLDVKIPKVANLFKNILVEFVQKYPNIDAVQWDDYDEQLKICITPINSARGLIK